MKEIIETWLHGECVIKQSKNDIPLEAKKVEAINGDYIIADSETIGNKHCIKAKEGIEFYEKDEILYMKNIVDAEIFCLNKERHDSITLQPGVYEIEKAKEYDYLKDEVRRIAD